MSLKQTLRKTSVIEILGILVSNDRCRYTDLKKTLGLSSSTLTRRLIELQKKGLVELIPNLNKKQFEYRLTTQGKQLAEMLALDRLTKALATIKR